MTTRDVFPLFLVSGVLMLHCTCPAQTFPNWHGTLSHEYDAWSISPIVAIGEVVNVRVYGQQNAPRFPEPMSPAVHRLYWCIGDFVPSVVLKGGSTLPTKRYVWASAFPGCALWLWPDNPNADDRRFQTRVWFLRVDRDFLRPTFDAGINKYLGLFTKWTPTNPSESRRKLAELLLTPTANSDSLDDYAKYFPLVVDMACDLLDRSDCAERIDSLARMGNASLRDVACGFLRSQFRQPCRPQ
jgi:hypothetical protein